jgi:CHAT domain-containing protein
LIEKFILLNIPALPYRRVTTLPKGITSQSKVLAVVAHTAGSVGIYNAEAEVAKIALYFPRLKLFEESPSAADSIKREIRRADVLHFIGHAADALKESELIRSIDFEKRRRRFGSGSIPDWLQLVTLSACKTGVTAEDGLIDTESLVPVFLSAGVPRIVASKWNVDSEAARIFMTAFYKELRRTNNAAASIRVAALTLYSSDEYRHPYYWAPFVIFDGAK